MYTTECWNGPYATSSFPVYAEPVPTSAEQVTIRFILWVVARFRATRHEAYMSLMPVTFVDRWTRPAARLWPC